MQNFLLSNTTHYVYLWGKPGVGRSHLLQACCHQAEQHSLTTAYLPLSEPLAPEMLENLECLDLVCLDDIDIVLGKPVWEQALFHFFNRIKDSDKHLVISGNCPPRELAVTLADLQSRLTSGTIFQLNQLTDTEKLQALQLHAHNRGMELSNDVGEFLLRRCTRDMLGLFAILDKLDKASLAEQRKLTIPFVKQSLQL